jgi:hypothetical protein
MVMILCRSSGSENIIGSDQIKSVTGLSTDAPNPLKGAQSAIRSSAHPSAA